MNRRSTNGLGLLVLLVLLLGSSCGRFSWSESYRYNKKQPYDLYALYELLAARPQGLELHTDTLGSLLQDSIQGANLLYVGSAIYLDEEDVSGLLNFVHHGNTAFLALQQIPEDLLYHLFGPSCFYLADQGYFSGMAYLYSDTVRLHLEAPGLLADTGFVADFRYRFKRIQHTWAYVDSAMICDPYYGLSVIGTVGDTGANMLQLRWGEGFLYLHTQPELFTNYYLSDSSRYHYAAATLRYLTDGPVFWNEYGRKRQPDPRDPAGNSNYNPSGGRQLLHDQHALRYILEQPALALAWYAFVLGILLFIFFKGKREQRAIPIRQALRNDSLAHVDTVASLALHHGHHLKLAKQELKSLRHHLLERYQIRWTEGQEPPANLAARLGWKEAEMQEALKKIASIEKSNWIEAKELLAFYRLLQPFYTAASTPKNTPNDVA